MFKKASYSDLEVQEMMETLFQEKKKVKELQVKLSQYSQNPTPPASSEELAKHKAEIQTLLIRLEEGKLRERESESRRLQIENELRQLKNAAEASLGEQAKLKADYQILLEQTEKRKLIEALETDVEPDKQKEAQLERVVQFMRTRLEEAQNESQQLTQKITDLEEKEKALLAALEKAKQASHRLVKEQEELKEEEQALKAQMELLREEVFKMQNLVHGEKENQAALTNAEKEIELLKQMMMKSLQENKEERLKGESEFQSSLKALSEELAKEKVEIETLSGHLKRESTLAREREESVASLEITRLKLLEELEGQKRAYHELAQFSEEMKSKIVRSEEEKAVALGALAKKEELIHNLSSQAANLSRHHEKMEDLTRQGEIEKQEGEARLRAAQQHLAKKMREMALLGEQYEELRLRNEEQEKALEVLKCKLIEMKAQIEAEAHQKQTIQKQYQEGLKAIELQSAKWEEKYFQMHEKWQETEARNRELKRLEERFGKMQSLFGNLGHLLGAPIAREREERGNEGREREEVEETATKKYVEEEISLFETVPSSSGRYKETLF